MTVLLLVALFCARRFLQGCLSWIVALAVWDGCSAMTRLSLKTSGI